MKPQNSKKDLTHKPLLHKWYVGLNGRTRRDFRFMLDSSGMYKKSQLRNWLSGYAKIPIMAVPNLYEAITTIDTEAPRIENIFPDFPTMKNYIHKLLAERQWTQAELAERAGVSRVTVNLIANGVSSPNGYNMMRIASAFNVPVEEVFPSEAKIRKSA